VWCLIFQQIPLLILVMTAKLLFIFIFILFYFSFGLTTQGKSTWKCHTTMSHKMKSHDNFGKVVHRPCSNCISSIQEMHKNSIEFSLLSTDKEAVGFILAQELAILTSTLSWMPWLVFGIPHIVLRKLPVGKAQTIIIYRVVVKLSSKLSLLHILPG